MHHICAFNVTFYVFSKDWNSEDTLWILEKMELWRNYVSFFFLIGVMCLIVKCV